MYSMKHHEACIEKAPLKTPSDVSNTARRDWVSPPGSLINQNKSVDTDLYE